MKNNLSTGGKRARATAGKRARLFSEVHSERTGGDTHKLQEKIQIDMENYFLKESC